MKTVKKILFAFMLAVFGLMNLSMFALADTGGSATGTLNTGTTNESVANGHLEDLLRSTVQGKGSDSAPHVYDALGWTTTDAADGKWADLFNQQVINIIGYVIDIFIVIWIAMAFFGWYKIMLSNKEESTKEGIRLVIFGIVWIIIMVSARFIAEWLVWDSVWEDGEATIVGVIRSTFMGVGNDSQPVGIALASGIYNKILYPFIKLALYFVIWILFFIMAAKVVGFLTATDDSVKKKAGWVIIWCVIWILIIMWAKQIVESIMWKQKAVLNEMATRISGTKEGDAWMWNPMLWFENIPLIVQIINWVMWLTMLAILVLIIIQGYKMFTKPDDPKNRESLKKTLLYVIIWVLVIWAAYAISSALVINKVPIVAS